MEKFGIFTIKDELELTKNQIEEAGFEIFETRALSVIDKLSVGFTMNAPIWVVMFYATREQYNKLLEESNDLTKVF